MLKVLIVDDMDIVRREIKRFKFWGEKTGFKLAGEAPNGQSALEILDGNSIDVVITDIRMPKIDGLELLRKIQEKNLCPCVVLLSDYAEFSYARQGIVLGAFDYMTKPVNEDDLESLLKRAKEFILEKYKEQDRVKNLEQNFDEKMEAFYPKADVEQIIGLIENGDRKCLEVAVRMVNITGANLDNDLFKVESVLKNVLFEISETIFKNKQWLEKFIPPAKYKNADFLKCKDIDALREIFINLIENICDTIGILYRGKGDNDILSQVSDYALASLDGDISVKSIADKLFLNRTYLSEAFKQKTGMTLVEYLTVVKMERAKKLLMDGKLRTYEIGDKLGFKDVEYFSRLFKRYSGISPSEFRQNLSS